MTIAGYPADEILGSDSSEAHSLREVAPFSVAATWIVTFFALSFGALMLPELCPPNLRWSLLALIGVAIAVAAGCLIVSRRCDAECQYRFFLWTDLLGVLIFIGPYVLAPRALPVLLIVSIGLPLQAAHLLRERDMARQMIVWTLIAVAATAYSIADGTPTALVLPIVMVVIPLLWILSWIAYELRTDRHATIDRNTLTSFHDSQTGLVNRIGLNAGVRLMLEHGELAAVMLVDLDNFKLVNTKFGHPGGDRVIATVAAALADEYGHDDLAARLGGDEFVVVFRGDAFDAAAEAHEAQRLDALIARVDNELGLDNFKVSVSCGIASLAHDGESFDELLRVAETRLVAAKWDKPRVEPAAADDDAAGGSALAEIPAPPVLETTDPRAMGTAPVSLIQRRILGAVASSAMLLATLPVVDVSSGERVVLTVIALLLLPLSIAPQVLLGWTRNALIVRLAGFAAYPLIGIAAAASGGATGPALPILLLLIAYDARDDGVGALQLKTALALAAAASPLFYSGGSSSFEHQLTIAISGSFLVMLPVVMALMVRNRRLLEVARVQSRQAAAIDPLTGLLNRRAFEDHATRALLDFPHSAVVMIDLDNFKGVNTVGGYDAGDRLLGQIGPALAAVTRSRAPHDLIGRVGGDEFAALLVDVGELNLQGTAQRFIDAVDEVVATGSAAVREVSASCGVAVAPDHGSDLSGLMQTADRALMQVKGEGKSATRIERP